jgi:hypothetical protein
MQFRATGLLLLGAMALPAAGAAQTTPAPPAIARTVVAATKLPTVTDVPLDLKAVSITLQPDEKTGVSAGNGILYQMSGSTEVAFDGEAKMLSAGEGLFIAGGKTAALTAGSGVPSTFLHFFLVPAMDLGRPVETAPAVAAVPDDWANCLCAMLKHKAAQAEYVRLAALSLFAGPSNPPALTKFMETFGLIYGAFDLIVTPEGRYVFLEINPSGQFMWLEYATGLEITAELADLLIRSASVKPSRGAPA